MKKTQPSLPGKGSIKEATVPLPGVDSTSSKMSIATTQTDDVPLKKFKCDAFTQTAFATEVSERQLEIEMVTLTLRRSQLENSFFAN